MPTKKEDLPSTIARSPKKVQRTYAETLDSAHKEYDKRAGVGGRSNLSKTELAEALRKHNDRETARARG